MSEVLIQKPEELTDEDKLAKGTERWLELRKKSDKTEDEKKEFESLGKNYGKKAQQAIDKAISDKKAIEFELSKERQRNEEMEKRLKDLENRNQAPEKPQPLVKDTVKIGEKVFYTDAALKSMVDSGQMTEYEAYDHQRTRDKEEAVEEAVKRIKTEDEEKTNKKIFNEDREKVLKKYPWMDSKHPDHDPNNPLYVRANKIYMSGYYRDPEGLSKAVELAEELLGVNKRHKDRSDDHNLFNSGPGERDGQKAELTDIEKEIAIKQFGNMTNPATGRNYTDIEAVETARKAKEVRYKTRRVQ